MAQVRHLLEHRGGWDRDKSFDAMFQSVRFAKELDTNAPADQATVIKSMFSRELDFAPGECYAYSNFGYCLLGRFIEKLSGQTYESYVRDHVLTPIGITSMKIGSSRLEGQAPNEVRYYQPGTGESVFQLDLGQDVAQPYGGWNLEAMDSHGGWIASAADLATFAAAFDNPDSCVLLRKESIDLMYQRPPGLAGFEPDGKEKSGFYSLGWFNRIVSDRQVNHWHTGSLDGTSTCMIRRHDGFSMVALLNSRATPGETPRGHAVESTASCDRRFFGGCECPGRTSMRHSGVAEVLQVSRTAESLILSPLKGDQNVRSEPKSPSPRVVGDLLASSKRKQFNC